MNLGNGCPPGQYMSATGECVGTAYCVTGQHFDTVLSKCVPDIPEKASLFSGNMVYIAIGVIALLLLGKR